MPNPIGNYARIKVWGTSDTVLSTDLNAEFDNVLDNFNPEMLASYSQNQAQMQIQTYPGGVGSESLATSIAGELERLRYQLNAIQGTTYWYQSPAATIAELVSALGSTTINNKITSGATVGTTGSVQPCFLIPANSTSSLNMPGATTPLAYSIAGSNYVISTNQSVTGLTAAPSSNNTCLVNDLTLAQAGTASSMLYGENGSQITVSSMGTSVSSGQIGNLAAFQTGSGTASEMFLARIESATQLTQVSRGYFFNSSSALVGRGTLATGGTLTMLKLAWIYANTAGSLSANYDNPYVGGAAPTSPNAGDYWFDTATNLWMVYSGGTWQTGSVTLIGLAVTNSSGQTIGARSFDFYNVYNALNTIEIYADQANLTTEVRARYPGGQVNVYGNTIVCPQSSLYWSFATNLDTGTQAASTMYYFYLDTNGKPFISLVAPYDRRTDLQGYYHPGNPWRCLGYGWSNSATQLENVESFFRTDDTKAVSNITAAANNIILPYNIIQQEQIITLTGAAGAFTQVLPPPAQLKGKFITYVRTDNNLGNVITLQSWGTAVANYTGTISVTSNPTIMTGLSSTTGLVAGQLITGVGIPPNTTVSSVASSVVTMSSSAQITLAAGTFNFANAAGYAGTVGQQTAYASYGINGFFTVPLNSQSESWTFTSDGFAYFAIQHYVPSTWITAGTTTIGATTTGPTKGGGTVTDRIDWRRVGQNAEIRLVYTQTSSGSIGNGDYLFSLPPNLTADTSRLPVFSTVSVGSGLFPTNLLGFAPIISSSGPTDFAGAASLYSSTQFRIQDLNNQVMIGSGVTGVALSVATLSYNASLTIPISGWVQ